MPGVVDAIKRMTKDLRARVALMVSRAIIETVKDGQGVQKVKVSLLKDEAADNVERFQNFGFSGNPPKDSEAIALSVGGNREHLVIIAADDRASRFQGLKPGESVMYSDKGTSVRLKEDESAEVLIKKLKVANDAEELVTVLSDVLNELVNQSQVITSVGPQPFTPSTVQRMQALKDRLDTFKV